MPFHQSEQQIQVLGKMMVMDFYLCLCLGLALPERLLGDMRTGEMEGVRDEEYGLCRSLSIVEDEATK